MITRADAIAVIPMILDEQHESYPEEREKLRKLIRREYRKGLLDVFEDQAADSVRHRDQEGVDWANMPAESDKFRFAVAAEVVSYLYETSEL